MRAKQKIPLESGEVGLPNGGAVVPKWVGLHVFAFDAAQASVLGTILVSRMGAWQEMRRTPRAGLGFW